jgi:hypothetical protein
MAIDPWCNPGDEPTRLAHLNDRDQRSILIEWGEGSAQVVQLLHGAHLSAGCFAAPKVPFPRSAPHSIYKPDAATNKPIAQLAIYALALTRRIPGLRLFDIKCAWFNEDQYCEFFPRTLLARRSPRLEGQDAAMG